MSRKELKKNAKGVLKRNYFKCILVTFIVGLLLNTGYDYASNNVNSNNTVNNDKTNYSEKNHHMIQWRSFLMIWILI